LELLAVQEELICMELVGWSVVWFGLVGWLVIKSYIITAMYALQQLSYGAQYILVMM
jgi:hypothetical protein